MKTNACLMSFEELVDYLQQHGIANWPGALTAQHRYIAAAQNELDERLQNTWWEVVWPANPTSDGPMCRYLADSLRDALRLRPSITLWAQASAASTHSLAEMLKLWEDEEDEYTELCCCD